MCLIFGCFCDRIWIRNRYDNREVEIVKLLDLYCGAGGAAMGYYQAGFDDIIGVDIEPQKRFPFNFVHSDALEYLEAHGEEFDLIHASPPCQLYSKTHRIMKGNHPDLIDATRDLCRKINKPYVIENVVGAPLIDPVMLCGTMFDLRTYRHRLFETYPFQLTPPPHPEHIAKTTKMGRPLQPGTFMIICGSISGVNDAREIMQIDWMIGKELAQAIPPAYTKWIGIQILARRNNV